MTKDLHQNMQWISSLSDLQKICAEIKGEPYIAVDTEFVRRHTYYPQLSLIQIQTSTACYLIDPLADGMQLDALKDIFLDPKILKIFHAAFQDLEIFHTLWKAPVVPMIDTQILAMMAGFEENISYQVLCDRVLDVQLDKTFQFMNWKKRPLSGPEKAYAAGDVIYLYQLFPMLKAQAGDRYNWAVEEMAFYEDPALFSVDTERLWKKFKKPAGMVKVPALMRLYQMVLWRDQRAMIKDTLPKYIISDASLVKVAELQTMTVESIKKALTAEAGGAKQARYAPALLAEIITADQIPLSEAKHILKLDRHKEPLRKTKRDAFKKACHARAEELNIVPSFLARSKDIEEFLRGGASRMDHGWRQTILHEILDDFKPCAEPE